MKLVIRVELTLEKILGHDNWSWIQEGIENFPNWEHEVLEHHEWDDFNKYHYDDFKPESTLINYRGLRYDHKHKEWVFEHGHLMVCDQDTRIWIFKETPQGWEWRYTTQSFMGKYEYRYKMIGFDSQSGIEYAGELTFEGARTSMQTGTPYFRIGEKEVVTESYDPDFYKKVNYLGYEPQDCIKTIYSAKHEVTYFKSTKPEFGPWESVKKY